MRARTLGRWVGAIGIFVCLAVIASAQDAPPGKEPPKTSDTAILDRARVLRKPAYPADARNAGLAGNVAVKVVLDADGGLVSARAVSGPDVLRAAAVKAVQAWEFASSTRPDDLRGVLVFRFAIGEPLGSIVGLREHDVAAVGPDPASHVDAAPGAAAPPPTPAPAREQASAAQSAPAPAGPERLPDDALAGRATRRVPPRYPASAEAARVEGIVIVDLDVNEDGRVTGARVRSGPSLLREAAVSAAREWRFAPVVVGGVPRKVTGAIAFNFRRTTSH